MPRVIIDSDHSMARAALRQQEALGNHELQKHMLLLVDTSDHLREVRMPTPTKKVSSEFAIMITRSVANTAGSRQSFAEYLVSLEHLEPHVVRLSGK